MRAVPDVAPGGRKYAGDMRGEPATPPLEVVIAGAGVAGLETLIALRSLAGPRVRITLLSPEAEFVYRPQSVGEPFGLAQARRYDIARIADDAGAELVRDGLARVRAQSHRVVLSGGEELSYDALVLALGARPEPVWPHVLTFRGPRDVAAMQKLVRDAERGETASVAFVVPTGRTWPLPLYELALMTARAARSAGHPADVGIYTPEREPLEVFGHEASRAVSAELDEAGVRVARRAKADVTPAGDLVLPFEEWPLTFERVVAIPRLRGPAPSGVQCDSLGFIETDAHGLVRGAHNVYAAGDGTDYPVKQGGIAAQQADAVAESIAKVAGAAIAPRPFTAVLRAQLLTGGRPRYLRGEAPGRAAATSEASDKPLWWPAQKIAGTYLAPYLAEFAGTAVPEPRGEGWPPYERIGPATAWLEESPYGE